ncbi:MAG: fimbrillin family protein [Candidatus Cryptobacteroides sp.]|nr:fimbrillin family protein [Candidatus Cryptobacteroides sp.]
MKISNISAAICSLGAAVALFAGCSKEVVNGNNEEEVVKVSVLASSPSTKTYVEGEKIYWSPTGECLNVVYRGYDKNGDLMSTRQAQTDAEYSLENGCASFTARLSMIDGSSSYKFGAFYPYSYKSSTSKISLTVPQTQTPTLTSFDPKADILVSSGVTTSGSLPDKLSFSMNRMVALVEMTLDGIGAGEKISTIEITASEKINGAVEFNLFAENTLESLKVYHNYETMTLEMGDRVATGNDVVWFTTVPTDLSGGSFGIKVKTDKNIYEKTADLSGKTFNFKRAEVAKFTIAKMKCTPRPQTYKILTDASDFGIGDKFIICSVNYDTESARLMSLSAYGSGLAAIKDVTVSKQKEIETVPEGVCVLEVEKGSEEGTLAFKCENGYLYGSYDDANYANTLSFKESKDEESSWSVSVASDNLATIYNKKFDRSIKYYYGKFSFSSASSTYIYYVNGESAGEPSEDKKPLATPEISVSATGNTVSVSWNAIAGAANYSVTCGSATKTVTLTSAEFTDLEYSKTYTVTVVANPSNAALNSPSEAGTATVPTEAAPSTGGTTVVRIKFPVDGVTIGDNSVEIPTGDDNIVLTGTGSWRTVAADKYNGIFMGSDKFLKVAVAKNGITLTKVEVTPVEGKSLKLKYETSRTYKTTGSSWEGEETSWVKFTSSGGSYASSITIEYTR